MVRRNARLQRSEDKYLLIAADLENGAAAVAYIKILVSIKGNPRRDFPFPRRTWSCSVRGHAIHRTIMARGNIHLSLAIEGDRSSIHHLAYEWLQRCNWINLKDRDLNFCPREPEKVA